MSRAAWTLCCIAACAVVVSGLSGCRGDRSAKPPRQFFPDLDDQEKNKAQSSTTFFQEFQDEESGEWYGRADRTPVEGTIPFGHELHANWAYHEQGREVRFMGVDFARPADLLREDDAVYEGKTFTLDDNRGFVLDEQGQRTFSYVERIPVPVTRELIDLGHQKYDIYCLPCHGGTGLGDGQVGQRWSYELPKFTDSKYAHGGEKGQDGYIFHTIRHGVPNVGGTWELKMPSYARKLSVHETWAVVAYFRTLRAMESTDARWLAEGATKDEWLSRKPAGVGEATEGGEVTP